jgi:hypothetical protein
LLVCFFPLKWSFVSFQKEEKFLTKRAVKRERRSVTHTHTQKHTETERERLIPSVSLREQLYFSTRSCWSEKRERKREKPLPGKDRESRHAYHRTRF